MSVKKRRIVYLLTLISMVSLLIGSISHINPTETSAAVKIPWISLTTNITTNSTEIGKEVIIDLLVSNNGEGTAYNVTIFQPVIYDWTFDFYGLEQYSYSNIRANSTRSLSYSVVAKAEGDYSFTSKCVYYDSEGQKYTTWSNDLELAIVESVVPREDLTSQWLNIISLVGVITIVLLAVRLVIKK
ncbi:MAG: hypothetical protein ACFFC7_27460 [Candidatus Hermodarchaeota archaeon]